MEGLIDEEVQLQDADVLRGVTLPIENVIFFGEDGEGAIFTTTDDEVFSIGSNKYGMLGILGIDDTKKPLKIRELSNKQIVGIACGLKHCIATTRSGDMYAWGCNEDGQLGLLTALDTIVPSIIPFAEPVKQVDCGWSFSIALTSNGVWCWGKCGIFKSKIPNLVYETQNLFSIASAPEFLMTLTKEGKITQFYGHDCNGSVSFVGRVIEIPPIVQMVCGKCIVLALDEVGQVYRLYDRHSPSTSVSGFCSPADKLKADPPGVSGVSFSINPNTYGGTFGGNPVQQARKGVFGFASPLDEPKLVQVLSRTLEPSLLKYLPRISRIYAVNRYDVLAVQSEHGTVFKWGSFNSVKKGEVKFSTPTKHYGQILESVFLNYQTKFINMKGTNEVDKWFSFTNREPTINISSLFNDKELSDLTITIHGKDVFVHKLILKLSCPFFKNRLSLPWMDEGATKLELNDYSAEVYTHFLQYIYTLKLIYNDILELVEMWHISNSYEYVELRKHIETILEEELTEENVIRLYCVASGSEASKLEEICSRYIMKNFQKIVQTDGFKQMDPKLGHSLAVKWAIWNSPKYIV